MKNLQINSNLFIKNHSSAFKTVLFTVYAPTLLTLDDSSSTKHY
jgi:hypothetical protein